MSMVENLNINLNINLNENTKKLIVKFLLILKTLQIKMKGFQVESVLFWEIWDGWGLGKGISRIAYSNKKE
jgi:hypothetical protein